MTFLEMALRVAWRTFGVVLVISLMLASCVTVGSISRYNVVWESPSKDETGQMPLGNGDIAAGVCAIEDGDLYLLLAKNDAYNYNGDIFKTGRIRISLAPNPFAKGKKFRQSLDMETGSIRIDADGMSVRIWADANRPVYHVEINSPAEITVTAAAELWKRRDVTQDVRLERKGGILWYFAVGDRSVYPVDMKYYNVEHMISKYPDPYRFNTFGNLLESPDLALNSGKLTGKGKSFDIRIHSLTKQTPKVSTWIETIERQAARSVDAKKDFAAHCRWWKEFWSRSWIIASDNTLPAAKREKFSGEAPSGTRMEADGGALVSQSYNVFRFIMACQSRGRIQAKFNGGLFTQPLRGQENAHADNRPWGRRFTFQNQRLLYWPLLMSGDGDLMKPFFSYYRDMLPIRKAITKAWFGHEGAYYRENIAPTGGERDCGRDGKPPKTKPGENNGKGYYHSYYFTSGLETVTMMTEYVKYSGDTKFRDTVLVPFAREVLLFFDRHYQRDADGKIRLDPAMVVETWWVAVNPAPDIAGLQFCLDELLAMKAGTKEDQKNWHRFRAEIPPIFLHEIKGRKAIAPAKEWKLRMNAENGELYPVFPFRCFGMGLGTKDIVAWTMKHRTSKNAFGYKCWTQDQIHWAYAGNAWEAKDGLIHRFRNASKQCRFPLYGSAKPDSCPDFDHFGSGSTALQRMLVQEAAGKILLLPAWPADWDVDFKLHLEKKTVISGKVVDGKLTGWSIEPATRRKDVVIYKPQPVPPRSARPTGRSVRKTPNSKHPLKIPVNKHPLRIGSDQAGGSRFAGKIARVTMFRGVLNPETIRALAAGDRNKKITGNQVVGCVLEPKAGDTLPVKAGDLNGEVSFEAWIMPRKGDKGRIFDKITGGKRDGFLIDCWPSLSLRLIVGSWQKDFPGALKPGVWQHVAVVIAKGKSDVYLDGKKR
ncbi:MAG: LamG domain-containing protein [bacterium]|nr:LamG domain-containing protein [bacterium]